MSYVVVTGNSFDGLAIWGPFENGEAANEWVDDKARKGRHLGSYCDWWVVELQPIEMMP